MEFSEAAMMMIVMPTMFGGMAWAFKALLNYFQISRLSKMTFELQNKVIDKFGTAPEALQYLESKAGARLLETAAAGPTNPRMRILFSVQSGVILAALGVGFLLVRGVMPEGADAFSMVGILALCLGVGFLVSAVIAHYLSKSWGLVNGDSERASSDL
ncbi:MAG: hypothetical protein K8R59_10485 [Thermoanaerobaculales bacterium]|nr:hypothetical protein [Thermoanaerobaculales bacterium]